MISEIVHSIPKKQIKNKKYINMAILNIYFTTMFDHIFKLFNDDHHQLQIKHKKLATDHVEELHQKHLQITKQEKELQTLRHSLDYYKKEADGLKTLVHPKISEIVKSMMSYGGFSWNKKKIDENNLTKISQDIWNRLEKYIQVHGLFEAHKTPEAPVSGKPKLFSLFHYEQGPTYIGSDAVDTAVSSGVSAVGKFINQKAS